VTLTKGSALEWWEGFTSRVGSGLPHRHNRRLVRASEMIDDARVVAEVLFQDLPLAIDRGDAFVRHRGVSLQITRHLALP
jgi:hypothetical protein